MVQPKQPFFYPVVPYIYNVNCNFHEVRKAGVIKQHCRWVFITWAQRCFSVHVHSQMSYQTGGSMSPSPLPPTIFLNESLVHYVYGLFMQLICDYFIRGVVQQLRWSGWWLCPTFHSHKSMNCILPLKIQHQCAPTVKQHCHLMHDIYLSLPTCLRNQLKNAWQNWRCVRKSSFRNVTLCFLIPFVYNTMYH